MNQQELLEWKFSRISRKITLTELSEHLGVSVSYVSYFESGKRAWNPTMIAKYKQYIKETNHNVF